MANITVQDVYTFTQKFVKLTNNKKIKNLNIKSIDNLIIDVLFNIKNNIFYTNNDWTININNNVVTLTFFGINNFVKITYNVQNNTLYFNNAQIF